MMNARSCLRFICLTLVTAVGVRGQEDEQRYMLIGVSGGLQEGFPDQIKMDYHAGQEDQVKAVFIGRAAVRGMRAYLDVMQPGWRQYTPEPQQPLINSVVIVSGCHEHVNQYWIYAVDTRQVLTTLSNEPRFLSITPDTGLVDLTLDGTDAAVKAIASSQVAKHGMKNADQVALPIVVATWYHESFVPSPAIATLEDGGMLTNFPESLAIWAGVNDADRTIGGCEDATSQECSALSAEDVHLASQRYWDGIRRAIRHAESNPLSSDEWKMDGPPFSCRQKTRLGTSADTLRINYAFAVADLVKAFRERGYDFDATVGTLTVQSNPPIAGVR